MVTMDSDIYAFIKPSLDAHTLGVNSAAELLRDCNYQVLIADDKISQAMTEISYKANQAVLIDWILENDINRISVSYRLDEDDAVTIMGYFMKALRDRQLLSYQDGPIKAIYFAGLPQSCERIEREHKGFVKTFKGGESVVESLTKMDVPKERIPHEILQGNLYDDLRMEFGEEIIKKHDYRNYHPVARDTYDEYGTREDRLEKRIDANMETNFTPLMRAHVGPYSSSLDRMDSVREFIDWTKYLAKTKFLDVISIGSSQLTQSNFGEDWEGRTNGGGVPVNSAEEYRMIYEASRPLMLRTYAGTKNIPKLAAIHEESINISWHALSLWWFNQIDGRGPYDLYTNLQQHFETIEYIATTDKPFEANVAHHFAFRGADDVTYVVSAFLAAKLAKKKRIKTFILQNMLNTPRATWGIQDLAKSRAILELMKDLEDQNFRIILQTRAGLDYFKPDLEEAKMQLAAVTALMDDIDPHDETSPEIIHVVSYSEAVHLATPEIINESIQITQYALQEYRRLRREGKIEDMSKNEEVAVRKERVLADARTIIAGIEKNIKDPYSPEGFYTIFTAGFLPVPALWGAEDKYNEFEYAKAWNTKVVNGSVKVVDGLGEEVSATEVVNQARKNIKEVEYRLSQKDQSYSLGK